MDRGTVAAQQRLTNPIEVNNNGRNRIPLLGTARDGVTDKLVCKRCRQHPHRDKPLSLHSARHA